MDHTVLPLFADLTTFAIIVLVPVLVITFTGHVPNLPGPPQLALLFAILLAIGVLASLPVLSVVASAVLLAIGVSWLSGRYALSGVSYDRSLIPPRLFPGDQAVITTRVRNAKLLPLAWFSLTDPLWLGVLRGRRDLPNILEFSDGLILRDNFEPALVGRGTVGPFGELTRTYRVTARMRGVYGLGPAEIESGDPFGLFRRTASVGSWQEIVVYPSIYTPDEVELALQEPVGEVAARHSLLEDPILLAGSREYRPGDPLRRVDWKATARTGGLRVRVSDPSTTAKLMIVLNLTTFRQFWEGMGTDRIEEAIRVAGSLAVWALDRGLAVGMHSNAVVGGGQGDTEAARVAPSAHPRQKTVLLDHLARLIFASRYPAERIVLEEAYTAGSGTSILLVTTVMTPELEAAVSARRLAGRVSVVYCASVAAPLLRNVPVHLVVPRAEAIHAAS